MYKKCWQCKYPIDIQGAFPDCSHKWHNTTEDEWDMCCLCGLDEDYLNK